MRVMFDGLRFDHWRHERRDDGILVLTLDRSDSGVNALSRAVLDELDRMLERIAIENPAGLIVRSGKDAGFAPGADIREFRGFHAQGTVLDAIRAGQQTLQKLAELPCPTVAAIHGHCMGGGTELALACDYRVAATTSSTRIGLPEVKLGIFPGWGGSVRLPRLIGAPKAMELMLTGRNLSAQAARALGLVDRTCDPEKLVETAAGLVRGRPSRPLGQRALAWSTNLWPVRQALAPILVKQTARKARKEHYPAPFALIQTWRRGGATIETRLEREARAVARLAGTDTARNLIRVFFLHERLKGLGGKEHGVGRVHVIGAGTMGGDIAAWCAYKGFEVSLEDREMKYVEPALQRAQALFEKKLKLEDQVAAARARLVADVAGERIPRADLVIEAIPEDLQIKRDKYAAIQGALQPDALLATNTSSIPLDALSEGLEHPGRFGGMHFFNPVAKMPLVEIVHHARMDEATGERMAAFCRAIDKLPVPVAGTPGFLVNRILMPYMLEAIRCLNEDIPGRSIDQAAMRFGMPMGPIELADTVGLDVAAHVGRILADFLELPIPAGLEGRLQDGKRGRKDGEGFYVWEEGRAKKPDLPDGYRPPEDLEDRLILPFINEAVACLHEGVVADADLLDAGVIFGTGFAPFRGGPIQYVRDTGAARLKARLEQLTERHGDRFAPRPGWDELIG
ncbi:MAG TPA: 3-hydroxyacyl-CoA dehydrogenase NAD-binding domain-containing protein [Xanthomonadaceae bacterium]|nr:3-hydroxyacyl-CoA dehydrogenase NAD-binding domain-containing protein [Xanthomonadaceae bacterium]